jgi:amidase
MKRWARFIRPVTVIALALSVLGLRAAAQSAGTFNVVEATIAEIERAYRSDLIDPVDLVDRYLDRIAQYDQAGPHLNSYLFVSDHAHDDALLLDNAGHDQDRSRKPLWGIPMIIKDNTDTVDMPTTAGSVALQGSRPTDDAFLVYKLRRAGAIILGKGSLTEFANFLTSGMPAGYSSLLCAQLGGPGCVDLKVGYGFNPYDPRQDPRDLFNDGRPALTPGGSSSGPGIAVAASLATVGIGTETSGSILSPGTNNYLVGIKPTVGLVSRDGIVPITADQDTAGPLARTVTDAAKVLGVIQGYDPRDPATNACLTPGNCLNNYTQFLKRRALRHARIAVPYFSYWTDATGVPNLTPSQLDVMNHAIDVLRAEGADVEFFDIPDQAELNGFPGCGPGYPSPPGCSTVLLYGFQRDLNAYLSTLYNFPIKTLADVVAFNAAHADVALKYGQTLAATSAQIDTSPESGDTARYLNDRAYDLDLSRTRGLDVVYSQFDAILFPANRGANIAARAGYPSIVVPGGLVTNQPELNVPPGPPFPDGFNPRLAPYGVTFSGPAFSESKLIGYAYAFEQATHNRLPPDSTPALPGDVIERQ